MTTLLHPSAASDATAAYAPPGSHSHSEAVAGGGVCCFQLAASPSPASLRLMRAFMQQLAQRLQRHQMPAEEADAAGQGGAGLAGAAAVARAMAASAALCVPAGSQEAMPADCFWMSL